jgi:hypothetical protein
MEQGVRHRFERRMWFGVPSVLAVAALIGYAVLPPGHPGTATPHPRHTTSAEPTVTTTGSSGEVTGAAPVHTSSDGATSWSEIDVVPNSNTQGESSGDVTVTPAATEAPPGSNAGYVPPNPYEIGPR